MPENIQLIEKNSAEMEEIVGIIPPWIIRWGITVLFIVGLLGIIISNFISYPDILPAKVVIQAAQQPGQVIVKREDANQIFKFLVKNGDEVNPGDTLLTNLDKRTGTTYVTTTPMAGKIYITNGSNEKNILNKVIWVVPKISKVIIKINYSNKGAGNVKVGQNVRIELFSYPGNEYGFIEGRISSILPVEVNDMHQAYVKLSSQKIITSDNKVIPFHPVMEGDGQILLDSRSIFQRIFGSIFHTH